jgi:hypothetical protein
MEKMKKLILAIAALSLAAPVLAQDHGGHGPKAGKDHGSMAGMDHSKMERRGTKIRDAKVEGYRLEYYFMDMKEMMEGMKAMGMQMKEHTDMSKMKTHHVMVFITGPDGKLVDHARVGFKVEGPGGEQRTMAAPMMGGHGADADFKSKGKYKLTMKTVAGEKTIEDEFSHELK